MGICATVEAGFSALIRRHLVPRGRDFWRSDLLPAMKIFMLKLAKDFAINKSPKVAIKAKKPPSGTPFFRPFLRESGPSQRPGFATGTHLHHRLCIFSSLFLRTFRPRSQNNPNLKKSKMIVPQKIDQKMHSTRIVREFPPRNPKMGKTGKNGGARFQLNKN